MNPNEFERTKPTVTYKKINDTIKNIDALIDEQTMQHELIIKKLNKHKIELVSMRNSFLNGE